RISRFYQLPKAVIPPERYVRLIGVIFAKKGIDPHYLGLTEQYACRILRMKGEAVSKPPYAAAEALAAADESIAEIIGAVSNGSFTKNIRRLKNSLLPPAGEITAEYKM
ncbi:hypothetical protein DRO55_05925, partial [Candidatus Bathyarchaeota archaeon]